MKYLLLIMCAIVFTAGCGEISSSVGVSSKASINYNNNKSKYTKYIYIPKSPKNSDDCIELFNFVVQVMKQNGFEYVADRSDADFALQVNYAMSEKKEMEEVKRAYASSIYGLSVVAYDGSYMGYEKQLTLNAIDLKNKDNKTLWLSQADMESRDTSFKYNSFILSTSLMNVVGKDFDRLDSPIHFDEERVNNRNVYSTIIATYKVDPKFGNLKLSLKRLNTIHLKELDIDGQAICYDKK